MAKRAKKPGAMDVLYWYGGEQLPLGAIMKNLQAIAPNQACVDRYVQGLQLAAEKPEQGK